MTHSLESGHLIAEHHYYNYSKITHTVQDDLLAGIIFGGFACGKKLTDFTLVISCHVPLSRLRLKQNGGFYIGNFFIEAPITNINSLPNKSSYTVHLYFPANITSFSKSLTQWRKVVSLLILTNPLVLLMDT